MKKFFAIGAALFFWAALFAQESLQEQDGSEQEKPLAIRSVSIDASGGTKEKALREKLLAKEGMTFKNQAELDAFVEKQKQELINSRLFEVSEIETSQDGDGNIDIKIKTVDTGHLMLLPYYKYSSNDGHTAKVKLKDDNFLGLMSPFSADIFFQYEQKENKSDDYVTGASVVYALPFSIGPIKASWNNDHAFKYAFMRAEPEWNFNTGFSFCLPFENASPRLDLTQGFVRDSDYKVFGDELYWVENARLSLPVVLERFDKAGNLVYTPQAEFDWKWNLDGISSVNEDLISPRLIFSHGLAVGQVNWIGNFRRGFSASAVQSAAYDFYNNMFEPGFKFEAKAFAAFKQRVGINSRLSFFAERERFVRYGEALRGVPDEQYFSGSAHTPNGYAAKSAAAMILNLEIPIKLMSIRFENWGMRFLRAFNMEIQVVPFIDLALAANRATDRLFDPRDGFYCAGLEFLMFPQKWKSVQIRASFGLDVGRLLLKDYIDTSWRDKDSSKFEMSFGIGLFY